MDARQQVFLVEADYGLAQIPDLAAEAGSSKHPEALNPEPLAVNPEPRTLNP